jgi:hypothetical protein
MISCHPSGSSLPEAKAVVAVDGAAEAVASADLVEAALAAAVPAEVGKGEYLRYP